MNIDLINLNMLFIVLGMITAFLGLILATYGIISWVRRSAKVATRVDQYVRAGFQNQDDPKASPIIHREVKGSFISRTLGAGLKKLVALLGRLAPQSKVEQVEHLLIIADFPANLQPTSFFAIRILLLLIGFFLAYLINQDPSAIDLNSLLSGMLLIIGLWMYPMVWLRGKARARQEEIQRGLPDALDMLSVCAGAGLGFDQSLQRISQYWDTEFGHELKRVTQEMEMGVSRADALRNLSARLDVDDLKLFVSTIIQAERIGMSYADVLHTQAEQMRILRQLRAREIANKLPAKMIIPLALFIFPAMLIVILGPAIPTLLSAF